MPDHRHIIPRACPDGLIVAPALAKALLAFALPFNPTRAHLSGLGLDDEACLTATDGCSLARVVPGLPSRDMYARRWWPGTTVTREIKIAAATKAAVMTLLWSDCASEGGSPLRTYPPGSQVVPQPGIGSDAPIACAALYLDRLLALAEALHGRDKLLPATVSLVSASGALDPLRFDIAGRYGAPDAQVVIMPWRTK